MAITRLKTSRFDSAEYLKDKKDIAAYLDAALADGNFGVICRALDVIVRARGMSQIARDSGIARKRLYKAIAEDDNTQFETVLKVMHVLRLRLRTSLPPRGRFKAS